MKYENLYTVVSDITDKKGQKIIVDLDVYDSENFIISYKIELDLLKMGLNKNMGYEFQLSKDLDRVVRKYYYNKNKLPQLKTIQNKMHHKNYLIIANRARLNYGKLKEKVKEFNELCSDWNYRNIDMGVPHLQGIDIKYRAIRMTCEKYDSELDIYIECNVGKITNQDYLKKFIDLDLENSELVLQFISSLEDCIDWKKIEKKFEESKEELTKEEEKEMEMN